MRGGYEMRLRPGSDPYERTMFVTGVYEPATLALLDDTLRPGDTMVDVGANLGLMALHAAGLVGSNGKVIAIEAHPAYYKRLSANVARNGLINIEAINAAAGATPGHATIIDVPSVNIGRSSLIDPGSTGREAGVARVDTLDAMLAGAKPSFIKIDVEGFESQVLQGGKRVLNEARPIICMEVNDDQTGPDHREAHDILMDMGHWNCFKFKHGKFADSAELVAIESRRELAHFHDNVVYKPKT